MKIENNVIDVFVEILPQIAQDAGIQSRINNRMVEKHNFEMGEVYALFRNVSLLNGLEEDKFICLLNGCYEETKIKEINPTRFFDKEEIEAALSYQEDRNEIELPYTFQGVLKGGENSFITILSYKQIYELHNAKLLTYNFDSQRIAKKRPLKNGEVLIEPKVYHKSVSQIYELMKKKKYHPSTIIFNILADGESEIVYEDGNLTVLEGSQINLIDGYHRVLAISKLLSEQPNFEGYMNVDIKHLDIIDAQELLATTNTTNPFDKTQRMRYANATFGSAIVKELEKLPEFENKISPKGSVSKVFGEYTTFSVMTESIDTIFDIQNSKEKYEISRFLKSFYSYFLSYYENEFKNRFSELESSWFTHHNMFVVFNVLAKKLYDKYGQDCPLDVMPSVLEKIDFRKNVNSDLNSILVTQGKTNTPKIRRELMNFAMKNLNLE